ncbi:MAG: IS21 family transposase [Nocardioides sp.]
MNIRRFRVLHEAGASYAEIALECDVDWRTVRKYLSEDGLVGPPAAPPRAGTQPQVITPFVALIEAWLRTDIMLRASVIYERLVADHGFTGHYQRVKMHLARVRPLIADELAGDGQDSGLRGLHRRFEVIAGAQAQVDWGEEGDVLAAVGIAKTYSFHMVLSFSRDPFTCFTCSMDLATFWDCHRRAFAHFGGVPGSIVYDRTKTVIKRHVAPGQAVPLHPEAAAFAGHYGFTIDPLAAYRPTGKGRVERQVLIVREHVLAGRSFASLAELDDTFTGWLPIRRAQVHRTHGQVIAVRAEADRAALTPLPGLPYLVTDRHLRRVGKDCLISFEASLYSVPARRVRAGQSVEVRASPDTITVHALPGTAGTSGPAGAAGSSLAHGATSTVLAVHTRSAVRGAWVVDPDHWDGLPDGHTRSTVLDPPRHRSDHDPVLVTGDTPNPLQALLNRSNAAATPVARRALSSYDTAVGLPPTAPTPPPTSTPTPGATR